MGKLAQVLKWLEMFKVLIPLATKSEILRSLPFDRTPSIHNISQYFIPCLIPIIGLGFLIISF